MPVHRKQLADLDLTYAYPELIAVASGHKPAGRLTVQRSELHSIQTLMEQCGFAVSTCEITAERWGYLRATDAQRAGLAAAHVRLYYSPVPARATQLAVADVGGSAGGIGELLGYPACCIAANELYGRMPMLDQVRVARVSDGHAGHWALNIFWTELEMPGGAPWYLISHFPCSLRCTQSNHYALGLHRLLAEEDQGFARDLEARLKLPVLLQDARDTGSDDRFGAPGAILLGVTLEQTIYYTDWWPLGDPQAARSALEGAVALSRTPEGIAALDPHGDTLRLLENDLWTIATFQP